MPASRSFIANFNGGELSPLLDARVDASAYRNGCRTLENFVARPYGGAFKRPGLQYGGAVKTAAKATRLIPFKRSTSTNYQLEFGDGYMRVWTGGSSMAQVTVSSVTAWATATAYVVGDVRSSGGVNYWCKVAHTSDASSFATDLGLGYWHAMTSTIFEIYSPYLEADLFEVQFCQINDVMFLAHPDYAPRKLSHTSATSWTFDAIEWDFPPMSDVNDTTTTITIQPNVDDWVTATGYTVGDVVLHDGLLYSCLANHTSGVFATQLAGGNWKLSPMCGPWERDVGYYKGDIVDADGGRYCCITDLAAGTNTSATYRPPSGGSYTTYWKAIDDNGGTLRMFASADVFTSNDVGASFRVDVGALKRTLFVNGTKTAGTTYYTEPLFAQGDILSTSDFQSGASTPILDVFLEESEDGATFDTVRNYRFSSVASANISSTYTGPVTGAYYRFRVYAHNSQAVSPGVTMTSVDGRVTALCTITAYTSATEVLCSFDLPHATFAPCEICTVPTTAWYRPAFTDAGYPRTVAFHDSRLFWGGVAGDAARVWGSRLDDYYNYLTAADDDSGLDLTLAATEANQIEWLTTYGRSLVIGTTGDEWTIDSGENDAVLTPTSARARRRTRHGSGSLAPQLVSDALLWVGRSNRRMYEFSYDFSTDRYQAPDMTQLAEHVTAGGIDQTAYSSSPDSVLWAVTGNGELLGFTYDRSQQITAWHRHVTDGTFESVSTIYGTNGRDEVWFVVNRSINGSTVRYIERFYPTAQDFDFDTATDLFYVDCGLKVTPSGTSVTGLSHLEGEVVKVWANGNTIESHTVSSGAITLSASATTAIVGLAMASKVQPMKLELMLDDGTGQGRKWRADRVDLCLNNSYGGTYAQNETVTAQAIDYSTPYEREQGSTPSVALYTTRLNQHIPSDWDDSIDFIVSHSDPTPFNLLGYILITQVEGH